MELMVVVVIVVSLVAAAYFSLGPRISVTRVESAALTLAELLETARAQALLKRCPTRIVLCQTRECPPAELAESVETADGGFIANDSNGVPVSFIGVLRRAQYTNNIASCFVPGGSAPADGYAEWDFELRPQAISQNIVISSIYDTASGGVWDDGDWSSITSLEAGDSVWFPRSLTVTTGLNELRVPANIPINAASNRENEAETLFIFFQVKEPGCDPASDGDCVAYFVGLNESGEGVVQPCVRDSERGTTKDACF